MGSWAIKDAKSRFSELVERAEREGPQTITRHGREKAVLMSAADYRALEDARPTLAEYLLGGPEVDDLPIGRRRGLGRPVDVGPDR